MAGNLEGGCACGAVRYRLGSAPMFVHCCHCRDCQRQTGSAFVLNALIETDQIRLLSGDPAPVAVPTDSGRPHEIYRCPACQTALWSDYGGRPALRFVRVGTLDDPTALAPDVHIYTRSKLPWVRLPEGVPAFDAYYDTKALWPAQPRAPPRDPRLIECATAGAGCVRHWRQGHLVDSARKVRLGSGRRSAVRRQEILDPYTQHLRERGQSPDRATFLAVLDFGHIAWCDA